MAAFRATDDFEAPRPALARSTKSLNARDGSKQLWLDAWADPVAGVRAASCCMHTCNLFGDGDWRLVVADADKRIKVTWPAAGGVRAPRAPRQAAQQVARARHALLPRASFAGVEGHTEGV